MKTMNSEFSHFLEDKLKDVLRPVSPNPDFVYNLENKLTRSSSVLLEEQKNKEVIALVGVGLFFGALLIWLLLKVRSSNRR